jgi:hypothetical protein
VAGAAPARRAKREARFARGAASANVPVHRIQGHTRRKSVDVLNGYIRESDRWQKSALKGLGF